MSFPVTINGVIKMELSEFEVFQLAATLTAPHANRYITDDEYVKHMFAIAARIKQEINSRRPQRGVELD
jgi:hypothetical protein